MLSLFYPIPYDIQPTKCGLKAKELLILKKRSILFGCLDEEDETIISNTTKELEKKLNFIL